MLASRSPLAHSLAHSLASRGPVAPNLKEKLRLLLKSTLPGTWQLCFLGFHESTGKLLPAGAPPRVVEIPNGACVTGLFAYLLTRKGAQVTAVSVGSSILGRHLLFFPHASHMHHLSCILRASPHARATERTQANTASATQRSAGSVHHNPLHTSRAPPVHLPCTSRAPLAQNSHIVRCLTLPVCAGAAQARRHLPSSASGRRRRLQCRLAALFALCPRPECGEPSPPWIRTSDPNQALPF